MVQLKLVYTVHYCALLLDTMEQDIGTLIILAK